MIDWALSHVANIWPARSYSLAHHDALDHLVSAKPKEHGAEVDPVRTALLGHSMGGVGVLYAASAHCRERICAVAALNPAHTALEQHGDKAAESVRQLCQGRQLLGRLWRGRPASPTQHPPADAGGGQRVEYPQETPADPPKIPAL